EQRAVREVGDPHQPEDEGKACRQQEQQPTESDAVDRQHQPEAHAVFPRPKNVWNGGRPLRAPAAIACLTISAADSRANRPAATRTSSRRKSRTGSRYGRS